MHAAGRRNCWTDQPDRQSLHDTAHITRISSTKSPRRRTAQRARHKGNPLLLPFIKAPVSFSERCRQEPDFCCSPCSSPPRMNWIRTNPTRPGEHASPTTAPVSRKRSGMMTPAVCWHACIGVGYRSYESCHLLYPMRLLSCSVADVSVNVAFILWPAYEGLIIAHDERLVMHWARWMNVNDDSAASSLKSMQELLRWGDNARVKTCSLVTLPHIRYTRY